MDRDTVKKVPDARVQDALDEVFDAIDEIYKEINKLKPNSKKEVGVNYM